MGWLLGIGLLGLGAILIAGFFLLGNSKKMPDEESLTGSELVEKFKNDLKDNDFRVRVSAAERLGKMGGADVSEALFYAMADRNEEVRMAAASALREARDPSITPRLIEALKEPNKWLPARVAEVLINLGQEALPALHNAVYNEDPAVRGYVIEILGEIGDAASVEVLHQGLKDSNPLTRMKAAAALGNIAHPESAAILAQALKDTEIKVKVQAARSLGRIGGSAAAEALAGILKDGGELLTNVALDALRRMGPVGWEVIKEAAASGHPAARKAGEVLQEEGISDSPKLNIKYERV